MIEPLAFATTVVCAVSAIVMLVLAIVGRYHWRFTLPLLLVLEFALVAQAVADVGTLVGGHRLAEPATHLAYLVTSVALPPVAGGLVARDDNRWSGVLMAVLLLVLAVVVVRMQTTWRLTGD